MRGRAATRSCSATSAGPSARARHRVRERVAQAGDDLERGQIDVGAVRADQPLAAARAVAGQDLLEPAEVLRQALLDEVARPSLRRGAALVLVVEPARDRVVRVVDLADEVRERELDLMRLGAQRPRRRARARGAAPERRGCWRSATTTRRPPSRTAVRTAAARSARRRGGHHRRHPVLAGARDVDVAAPRSPRASRRTNSPRPWMPGQ